MQTDIPRRVELWVSNADATGVRRIGWLPQKPGAIDMADDPHSVRWLVDGKHVSFVDRNALWVVPVD
jgi:hypothetical protein